MTPDRPADDGQRQRRASSDIRASLLDAGLALLSDRDIEALTVDEIVQRAGVAKGSFYSHFTSKEAIAASIARDIREDIERRVGAANQGIADPAERIARAILVYLERALAEPLRARLMLKGAIGDFAPDAPLQRGVVADIRAGRDQGRLRVPSIGAGVMAVQGCAYVVVASAAARLGPSNVRTPAGEVIALVLTSFGLPEAEAKSIVAKAGTSILGPADRPARGA